MICTLYLLNMMAIWYAYGYGKMNWRVTITIYYPHVSQAMHQLGSIESFYNYVWLHWTWRTSPIFETLVCWHWGILTFGNWAGGAILVANANEQKFLCVCTKNNTYSCIGIIRMWLCLLRPASTTTVHAGTPSKAMLFVIACSFSAFPVDSHQGLKSYS